MSENNGRLLTIPEAAEFANTSMTTIYRYIRKGKLHSSTVEKQGKNIKVVSKIAVKEAFEGVDISRVEKHEKTGKKQVETITLENINKVIQEAILSQEKTLTKPLEKQAMYLAGKYETENKFLQEKLDTVLSENEKLQETIKALPDKAMLKTLEKEKEELNNRLDEEQKKSEQLQEGYKAEMETMKDEERDYLATIEELKRQLEEEQNKSWWEKIFS